MLPVLYRVWHLTWSQIEDMPRGELDAVLDDLHQLQSQPGG